MIGRNTDQSFTSSFVTTRPSLTSLVILNLAKHAMPFRLPRMSSIVRLKAKDQKCLQKIGKEANLPATSGVLIHPVALM